jgi:hypothetical protein
MSELSKEERRELENFRYRQTRDTNATASIFRGFLMYVPLSFLVEAVGVNLSQIHSAYLIIACFILGPASYYRGPFASRKFKQ